MIIKVKNKNFCVIVPQKSGISTVTNILGYPTTGKVTTKSQIRRVLKRQNMLYHIGSTLDVELDFANENNIKIDYLFGIYRDPIERFKSAYKDRVIKKNKDQFIDGSLDYIIDHLENLVSSNTDFGMHARTQTTWLGDDFTIFDKVFHINDLNTFFKQIVEDVSDVEIPDIRSNSSNDDILVLDIDQINKVKKFYKKDLDFISSL